jgi:hypothetical protein
VDSPESLDAQIGAYLWDSKDAKPLDDTKAAQAAVASQQWNYYKEVYSNYLAGKATNSMALATPSFASIPSGKGPSLISRHRNEFYKPATCPGCHQPGSISNVIQHLNDVHEWTREKIADWLDTLDEQPIFYPDTCGPDCECSDCNPPAAQWHAKPIGMGKLEHVLTAEQIQNFAISTDKITASSMAFAIEMNKVHVSLKKMWDNILITMEKKPAPLALQITEAVAPADIIKSYNDSWKLKIELPDKAIKEMSSEQVANVTKLIQEYTSQSFKMNDNVKYVLSFSGSHHYCAGIVNKLQEYLNVPEYTCNCTGKHYVQGVPCPKHATGKSTKHSG